jgi:hypothetical protein
MDSYRQYRGCGPDNPIVDGEKLGRKTGEKNWGQTERSLGFRTNGDWLTSGLSPVPPGPLMRKLWP